MIRRGTHSSTILYSRYLLKSAKVFFNEYAVMRLTSWINKFCNQQNWIRCITISKITGAFVDALLNYRSAFICVIGAYGVVKLGIFVSSRIV